MHIAESAAKEKYVLKKKCISIGCSFLHVKEICPLHTVAKSDHFCCSISFPFLFHCYSISIPFNIHFYLAMLSHLNFIPTAIPFPFHSTFYLAMLTFCLINFSLVLKDFT